MVKPTSAFRTTANSHANENENCCKHERSAEFLFIHHLVLWSGRPTAFSQEIRAEVSITVLLISVALTLGMQHLQFVEYSLCSCNFRTKTAASDKMSRFVILRNGRPWNPRVTGSWPIRRRVNFRISPPFNIFSLFCFSFFSFYGLCWRSFAVVCVGVMRT